MPHKTLDSTPKKGSNHYKNNVFLKLGNKSDDECKLPEIANNLKLSKVSHKCDGDIRYSTIKYNEAKLVNNQPICQTGALFLVGEFPDFSKKLFVYGFSPTNDDLSNTDTNANESSKKTSKVKFDIPE
jgi:hypothetical protein